MRCIEYSLICVCSGESHGGFISLRAARAHARAIGMAAWDIWRLDYPPHSTQATSSRRIELHNPAEPHERIALPVPKTLRKRSPAEFEAMAEEARALAETKLDAHNREMMKSMADAYVFMASAARLVQQGARI